jgi:FkbM family methyltransferase
MMKRFVQSTLKMFGYRLSRIADPAAQAFGLDRFFSTLRRRDFSPKHVIDVGANRGAWTRAAIGYFPDAYYSLVEPQDHLKAHIQDLIDRGCKIQWITAGAADKTGSLPFAISRRDDSCSFVMTGGPGQSWGPQPPLVRVTTLNEIVASSSAPPPEMVKIDAEGFDLKVLAGGSELLGKTDVFLVEAMICAPDYENTLGQVIQRMAAAGYRLIDITDLNRSPKHGVLWLCEAAFLRSGSRLFDDVTSYE